MECLSCVAIRHSDQQLLCKMSHFAYPSLLFRLNVGRWNLVSVRAERAMFVCHAPSTKKPIAGTHCGEPQAHRTTFENKSHTGLVFVVVDGSVGLVLPAKLHFHLIV